MNFYSRRILLVLALAMPLANVNAGTQTPKKKENAVVEFLKDHGAQIVAGLGVLVAAVFCYKFFIKKEETSGNKPSEQPGQVPSPASQPQLTPEQKKIW